uniref:TATA box binding protein associated factor (TAF) histone-like fold domain-containing protein n=1 Tax=Lutzomyia longipalpis TaxID=7200 RepID=A0A1B0CD79_LUTLO
MSDPDMLYGTTLSVESIKVIAESIGVGALPDGAAKELADDISYKLKQRDYGFLGPTLHQAVVKARSAPPAPTVTTPPNNNSVTIVTTPIAPSIPRPHIPQVINQQRIGGFSNQSGSSTISRQSSQSGGSEQSQQKFVIVTQRPNTPQTVQSTQVFTLSNSTVTHVPAPPELDDLSHLE